RAERNWRSAPAHSGGELAGRCEEVTIIDVILVRWRIVSAPLVSPLRVSMKAISARFSSGLNRAGRILRIEVWVRPATFGVELDDIFQRAQTAVMHVRCSPCDIAGFSSLPNCRNPSLSLHLCSSCCPRILVNSTSTCLTRLVRALLCGFKPPARVQNRFQSPKE